MVQGHHLQLRYCPPLFHNFQWINIRATPAHHSISQKELGELLAKGAIEPSSGGAGFYSNIFVAPKHMDGLCHILNLKQFDCYMHIPTLGCLLSDRYSSLFKQEIIVFLLISRMLFHVFLLLSIIIDFYDLFGNTKPISGKVFLLGLLCPLEFSLLLGNPHCSFALKGFACYYLLG